MTFESVNSCLLISCLSDGLLWKCGERGVQDQASSSAKQGKHTSPTDCGTCKNAKYISHPEVMDSHDMHVATAAVLEQYERDICVLVNRSQSSILSAM